MTPIDAVMFEDETVWSMRSGSAAKSRQQAHSVAFDLESRTDCSELRFIKNDSALRQAHLELGRLNTGDIFVSVERSCMKV